MLFLKQLDVAAGSRIIIIIQYYYIIKYYTNFVNKMDLSNLALALRATNFMSLQFIMESKMLTIEPKEMCVTHGDVTSEISFFLQQQVEMKKQSLYLSRKTMLEMYGGSPQLSQEKQGTYVNTENDMQGINSFLLKMANMDVVKELDAAESVVQVYTAIKKAIIAWFELIKKWVVKTYDVVGDLMRQWAVTIKVAIQAVMQAIADGVLKLRDFFKMTKAAGAPMTVEMENLVAAETSKTVKEVTKAMYSDLGGHCDYATLNGEEFTEDDFVENLDAVVEECNKVHLETLEKLELSVARTTTTTSDPLQPISDRIEELNEKMKVEQEDIEQDLRRRGAGVFDSENPFADPDESTFADLGDTVAQGLTMDSFSANSVMALIAAPLLWLASAYVPACKTSFTSFGSLLSMLNNMERAGSSIDTLKYIGNLIYYSLTGNDYWVEYTILSEFRKSVVTVNELMDQADSLNNTPFVIQQKIAEQVRNMKTCYTHVLTAYPKDTHVNSKLYDHAMKRAQPWASSLKGMQKMKPIVTAVSGSSGTGKTWTNTNLIKDVMAVCYKVLLLTEVGEDLPIYAMHAQRATHFSVNCMGRKQEFDDGYMDPLWYILEEYQTNTSTEIKAEWADHFMRCSDAQPFLLNMAFAEKGSKFFSSPFVMATGNYSEHFVTCEDPDAYYRRIEFDLIMKKGIVPKGETYDPLVHGVFYLRPEMEKVLRSSKTPSVFLSRFFKEHKYEPINYKTLVFLEASVYLERVLESTISAQVSPIDILDELVLKTSETLKGDALKDRTMSNTFWADHRRTIVASKGVDIESYLGDVVEKTKNVVSQTAISAYDKAKNSINKLYDAAVARHQAWKKDREKIQTNEEVRQEIEKLGEQKVLSDRYKKHLNHRLKPGPNEMRTHDNGIGDLTEKAKKKQKSENMKHMKEQVDKYYQTHNVKEKDEKKKEKRREVKQPKGTVSQGAAKQMVPALPHTAENLASGHITVRCNAIWIMFLGFMTKRNRSMYAFSNGLWAAVNKNFSLSSYNLINWQPECDAPTLARGNPWYYYAKFDSLAAKARKAMGSVLTLNREELNKSQWATVKKWFSDIYVQWYWCYNVLRANKKLFMDLTNRELAADYWPVAIGMMSACQKNDIAMDYKIAQSGSTIRSPSGVVTGKVHALGPKEIKAYNNRLRANARRNGTKPARTAPVKEGGGGWVPKTLLKVRENQASKKGTMARKQARNVKGTSMQGVGSTPATAFRMKAYMKIKPETVDISQKDRDSLGYIYGLRTRTTKASIISELVKSGMARNVAITLCLEAAGWCKDESLKAEMLSEILYALRHSVRDVFGEVCRAVTLSDDKDSCLKHVLEVVITGNENKMKDPIYKQTLKYVVNHFFTPDLKQSRPPNVSMLAPLSFALFMESSADYVIETQSALTAIMNESSWNWYVLLGVGVVTAAIGLFLGYMIRTLRQYFAKDVKIELEGLTIEELEQVQETVKLLTNKGINTSFTNLQSGEGVTHAKANVTNLRTKLEKQGYKMQGIGDGVIPKLERNRYEIMANDIGQGSLTFLEGAVAIMNYHVWRSLRGDFEIVPFVQLGPLKVIHAVEKARCVILDEKPKLDYVLVVIPRVRPHANITHFFMTEKEHRQGLRETTGVISYYDPNEAEKNIQVISNIVISKPLEFTIIPEAGKYMNEIDRWYGYDWKGNSEGMCGALALVQTNGSFSILGQHCAGSRKNQTGMATVISHDLLYPFVNSNRTATRSEKLDTIPAFQLIGITDQPRSQAYSYNEMQGIACPIKTSATDVSCFVPTVFTQEEFLGGCGKLPACMDYEAYQNALKKEQRFGNAINYDESVVDGIMEYKELVLELFLGTDKSTITGCRTMTAPEALDGSFGLNPFDKKTSKGIRLRIMGLSKANICDKIEPDYSKFIEHQEQRFDDMDNGEFEAQINADKMKDELRPALRVEKKESRVFKNTCFGDLVTQKQAIGMMISKMKKNYWYSVQSCGLDPGGGMWRKIYYEFFPNTVIWADISGFESIVTTLSFRFLWYMICMAYSTKRAREKAAYVIISIIFAIRFNLGIGFILGQQNTSGNWITTWFNTVHNNLLFTGAVIYGCKRTGMDPAEVLPKLRMRLYSDDNITCLPGIWWYTPKFLQGSFLKLYSVVLVSTDKSPMTEENSSGPITSAEFLSRKFRFQDGQVFCPLDWSSLISQIYYVRCPKAHRNDRIFINKQLQQNLDNVARELLEYPDDEASKIADAIRGFIEQNGVKCSFAYDEAVDHVMIKMLKQ